MNTQHIKSLVNKAGSEFKKGRWVTNEEGELIRKLVALARAVNVFESGTANGYSACWLSLSLPPEGKVHTFDPIDRPKLWDQSFGVENIKDKAVFHQNYFKEVKSILGGRAPKVPFGFFIDGDHGSDSVMEDWNSIAGFLQPGDVIIFHDLNIKGVRRAWDTILSSVPPSRNFVFNTDRIVGVIFYGVSKIPVANEDGEVTVVQLESEMRSENAKVRDVKEWRNDSKPWTVYPERVLLTSSESHYFYDAGKRLGFGNYAHLGVFTGASVAYNAFGLRDAGVKGKIYAVDTFDIDRLKGYPERMINHFSSLGLLEYLEVCKGYTSEWSDKLKDVKFKFILVDAGHKYKDVKEDFDKWSPLLEIGGEIAFHDVEYSNVHKLIEEELTLPKWKFLNHVYRLKAFRKLND